MKKEMALALFLMTGTCTFAQNSNSEELSVWFDHPTSLKGKSPWYIGSDNQWKDHPEILENAGTRLGRICPNWDKEWESCSLPIGNGSIGANIMGSIETERITFNEKTLWRGGPNTPGGADYYWQVNKPSAHLLKDIREALEAGDSKKAGKLLSTNFNSEVAYRAALENPYRFGNFTTMGEFSIATGHATEGISNYVRKLSLDSALVTVKYTTEGVQFQRRSFISYPDNVMGLQFKADHKGKQNLVFSYSPTPVAKGKFVADGTQGILYQGALNSNGMRFDLRVQAINKGGRVWVKDGEIHVKDADEVCFYITADTDYKLNFDPDFKDPKTYVGVDPDETTRAWMEKAKQRTFSQLLQTHYDDYSSLFHKVDFRLTDDKSKNALPTPTRLAAYKHKKTDLGLEALYFQMGRYLLIASSRAGNMPANLQGMWHNNVDGPWRVDYHNNINIQMNYWPANVTNLAECCPPLFDYIRSMMKPGAVTAKSYFGARGWATNISSNIFGFTSPIESTSMTFNFNPMAGPWLATHVWDYYDFTRDLDFLKHTGYEIIKSSALFTIDYLYKKSDGTYTASPSTSPEHGPVDEGTTFAHGVAREILLDAIAASKVLNVDEALRQQWQEVFDHLAPYKIGRYGQLQEWSKDIDDPKDNHRHVNHLFGLHPGRTISPVTTPDLAEASRVALVHRGDGATGWSMGWKLNQWARLFDGNHAYVLLCNLLKNGTVGNLLDVHPPFQIDGNFGACAGIAELLLQSHAGFVHLLPALPDAWATGQIKGLCARGGFVIDIKWKDRKLESATIHSLKGTECHLRYGNHQLTLPTQPGKTYLIEFLNDKLQWIKS